MLTRSSLQGRHGNRGPQYVSLVISFSFVFCSPLIQRILLSLCFWMPLLHIPKMHIPDAIALWRLNSLQVMSVALRSVACWAVHQQACLEPSSSPATQMIIPLQFTSWTYFKFPLLLFSFQCSDLGCTYGRFPLYSTTSSRQILPRKGSTVRILLEWVDWV